MEGKAVLFKKFAGIDSIDIEIDERDPQAFIDTVARLEPSFGAINLEDIKAPECFEIERELRARMNIPVFHDDQHGTAIIVAAAVRNGLAAARQGAGRCETGQHRRRRGGPGLPRPSAGNGPETRERHGVRRGGRGLGRPPGHRPLQGALRPGHQREDSAGGAGRRRRVSRPVRPQRAEAGMAGKARAQAPGPGAGQSGPGDHARFGAAAPSGRHRGDGPDRLPQPGQQRAVLPLHLPRRVGCRRHHHQRGDEGRRGGSHRRAGPGRGVRGGRRGLWRRRADLRPRIHHPQALRPAA